MKLVIELGSFFPQYYFLHQPNACSWEYITGNLPDLLLPSSLKMSSSVNKFEYELCKPLSQLHVAAGRARDGHTVGVCHMKGVPLDLTAPFFFYLVDNCSSSGSKPRGVKSLIKYHTQETGRLIR